MEIVAELETEDRVVHLAILDELDVALGRHLAHILGVVRNSPAENDSPQVQLNT